MTKSQNPNVGTEESREVTFLSAVRGKVVLHRYDYTSEERLATWWDADEIERMRKNIADMEVAGDGNGEYYDGGDNEPGSMIESSISEDSASSFTSSSSSSSFSSFRALQIKEPPMVPRLMKRRRRKGGGSNGKDKKPIKLGQKSDTSVADTAIASALPLRSCMVEKEKAVSSDEENHEPAATSISRGHNHRKKFKNLKVTFARSKVIRPALHRNHFTPSERRAVWYSKEDLLRIKKENLQTIRSMMSVSPSSSSSSDSTSSFSEPHWRGLEKQTRLGVMEKNEMKRIAREAVFEEQAVQKLTQVSSTIGSGSSSYDNSNSPDGEKDGKKPRKRLMLKKKGRRGGNYAYDADAIAKVYREHTKKSEEEALTYAIEDELAASIVDSAATTHPAMAPSVAAPTASFAKVNTTHNMFKSSHVTSPSSKSMFTSRPSSLVVSTATPAVVGIGGSTGVNGGRY